jgi:hypothetical protein
VLVLLLLLLQHFLLLLQHFLLLLQYFVAGFLLAVCSHTI